MNDTEAFLCTYRAARNMAFQGLTSERGAVHQLVEIHGSRLVGTRVKAPFAINPEVYVLPMENVLSTKVRNVSYSFASNLIRRTGNWGGHIRALRLS
jgi:leucyl-tRNA synthetase